MHSLRLISHSSLFWIVVACKLFLIWAVAPQSALDWYVPFLEHSISQFSVDPWKSFLAAGGNPNAFPYGYVAWLIFLPICALIHALSLPVYWGYGLILLSFDIALLWALAQIIPRKTNLLLKVYWCSPIILFATYWLGLNDLVPVCLLVMALWQLSKYNAFTAGCICGAAVSAKLSMVLAIPFFAIYLFRNVRLRDLLTPYIKGLISTGVVFLLPFFLSANAMHMLTNNPEMSKVFNVRLQVGEEALIFILPMTYCLLLYYAWHIKRLSFELFMAVLSMVFFAVLLLTPASSGWFIWLMPFLAYYQLNSDKTAFYLVLLFTLFYVAVNLLTSPQPTLLGTSLPQTFATKASSLIGDTLRSTLDTLLLTLGLVIVARLWRQGIQKNDYFRISRKPLVLGIAGDSGAGKDTLANALEALFGTHSVVKVSGDDYHHWDRYQPMWKVMTHLNPRANDLDQFSTDVITLADGNSIISRHYDHSNGLKTKPFEVQSKDIVIASGLHALYLENVRSIYDLSIFLDIDESLRRHFKIQRDVHHRGHTLDKVLKSIMERARDSARFIGVQHQEADLVFSLQPTNPRILEHENRLLRFKLFFSAKQGFNEAMLQKVLVGLCGLHVDMHLQGESGRVEMTIEGETSAEDIALGAQILVPEMENILDRTPGWEGSTIGLMQLITLTHIKQKLYGRIV